MLKYIIAVLLIIVVWVVWFFIPGLPWWVRRSSPGS